MLIPVQVSQLNSKSRGWGTYPDVFSANSTVDNLFCIITWPVLNVQQLDHCCYRLSSLHYWLRSIKLMASIQMLSVFAWKCYFHFLIQYQWVGVSMSIGGMSQTKKHLDFSKTKINLTMLTLMDSRDTLPLLQHADQGARNRTRLLFVKIELLGRLPLSYCLQLLLRDIAITLNVL